MIGWMRHVHRPLLLVAGTVACGGLTGPDVVWPERDLRVTTAVSRATLRQWDTLTVTLAVHNAGRVAYDIVTDRCVDAFVVTTTDGSVVGPGPIICSLIGTPLDRISVAPGASIVLRRTWLATGAQGGHAASLASREYLVRAHVPVLPRRRSGEFLRVTGEPSAVLVLPR